MEQRWSISQLPPAMSWDVQTLFSRKYFIVPDYQRNYAWEKKHWKDFWEDIKDGILNNNTPHYWGQITLRDTGEEQYCGDELLHKYEIVDGQQRIATLYLFLLALSKCGKPAIKERFIKCNGIYMLELGSLNKQFLKDLIDGRDPRPDIETNRLLKKAIEYFEDEIRTYGRPDDLSRYLQHITFLTEFALPDEALAIRAFQSLNDRGRDLTLLDKTKSFLMFYSMRYLEKQERKDLSSSTNIRFGNIFTNYDIIKELGDTEKIFYIAGMPEDELLRLFYHYFFNHAKNNYSLNGWYNYDMWATQVFSDFLKPACNKLKDNPTMLKEFIGEFIDDLDGFISAFKQAVEKTRTQNLYRKLFCFLQPSAIVYPLIISLEKENLLTGLLDIVETLELRVYTIKGTNPRASLYRDTISNIKGGLSQDNIRRNIKDFINFNVPDPEFRSLLIIPRAGERYILWEFEKYKNNSFNDFNHDLYVTLEIEHIFPQKVPQNFPTYGFESSEEYVAHVGKFGNLCLLEREKNKRAGNKEPPAKADIYQESAISVTKDLGHSISNKSFTKEDVEKRTQEIVEFCLKRWPIT